MNSTRLILDSRRPNTLFGRLLKSNKAIMAIAVLTLMAASGHTTRAQDTTGPTPFLPEQVRPVSTVPPNGDLNPYGVAFVPNGFPTQATFLFPISIIRKTCKAPEPPSSMSRRATAAP
jgi:hypothetical protein